MHMCVYVYINECNNFVYVFGSVATVCTHVCVSYVSILV